MGMRTIAYTTADTRAHIWEQNKLSIVRAFVTPLFMGGAGVSVCRQYVMTT